MTTGYGMTLISALGAVKAGIYDAAKAVYDPATTYVSSGDPSQDVIYELVQIGTVAIAQTPATLSNNRGREEVITADVMISVFTGGSDDQQQRVDLRAAELLTLLEQQVHYTDTTLDGAVRECFLTSASLDSGPGAMGNNTTGRLAVINAVFTAKARVTR